MDDWKERIVEEKKELDEKIDKLRSFLSSYRLRNLSLRGFLNSYRLRNLSFDEAELMFEQYTTMGYYSSILKERLKEIN
jgi:hypothetical protein